LSEHGISVDVVDLNALGARMFGAQITPRQAIAACKGGRLDQMNGPYLEAQSRLDFVSADDPCWRWDVQEGFAKDGCDLASSESVRVNFGGCPRIKELYDSEIAPAIQRSNTRIIGFSITVPGQLLAALELCRLLRESGFDGIIVLGGNLVTRLHEDMRAEWLFSLADVLVAYQGETSLLALWRLRYRKSDWHTIPNLIWRDESGLVRENALSTLTPGEFAGPVFDNHEFSNYWGIPYVPMIGSRGCYYGKCSFCAIPYAWGNNGFLGNDTAARIAQYIEGAVFRHGLTRFKFADEALHPVLMKQLSDILLSKSLDVEFEGYARLERTWAAPDLVRKLAAAGLRKLYFGLELAPSSGRNALNKSDDADDALEILKLLCEYGVRCHVFCLFGYPGTGTREAMETVEFVLNHKNLIDSLDVFPFSYARHTKVSLVRPVIRPEQDWAVNYDFIPERSDVLPPEHVRILAEQVEGVLWAEQPRWLHPLYRLVSPWRQNDWD
jgi:hypothetical protein